MNSSRRNSPRVQALHIDLLKRQADALLLVQRHHRVWMYEADDPTIRALYEEVIQSLDQTLGNYEGLVTELQSQLGKG